MEEPVCFENEGQVLRGILHAPDRDGPGSRQGIIILNGWSGCRIGPHRMFVKAARRFCDEGYACLRFDFRGRGESGGVTAEATIRSMVSDTRCAMDLLLSRMPSRTIVLLAICSGCKVAIGATSSDVRPAALALWSAEPMGGLRGAADNTRKSWYALRQYARKAIRLQTWRKILSLKVNTRLVGKALLDHETAGEAERKEESVMLGRFRRGFNGRMLFIHGSHDPETKGAAANYARFCRDARIEAEQHEIAGANHSFYSLAWEEEVINLTERWLLSLQGALREVLPLAQGRQMDQGMRRCAHS